MTVLTIIHLAGMDVHAASPGLPLLEDFKDPALLDADRTNALWLEGEHAVLQAFQAQPWQSSNRIWPVTEIGPEINSTDAVATGDLNNDGFPDIVTANSKELNRFYLNQTDGRLGKGLDIGTVPHDTACLALGDLNGDGYLDVVFGNVNELSEVYFNNGQGGFDAGRAVSNDINNTRAIALGDINEDGRLDVICGNYGSTNRLYINRGDGAFDSGTDIAQGKMDTRAIKVADMDGDGHLDIVTGNWAQPNELYFGDGEGIFLQGEALDEEARETTALNIGDINNDGMPDVIAANYARKNRLYLNLGNKQWEIRELPDEDYLTNDICLADLDGNGALDVVTADNSLSFHYFLNDGKGSFGDALTLVNEVEEAMCVATGDMNGDGRIDVVGGNQGARSLLFLNNGCVVPLLGSKSNTLPGDNETDTTAMTEADLNGDGFPDIITGNMNQRTLYYLNDGSGMFFEGRTLTESIYKTTSVGAGDLNQDGLPDVVAGNMKQKNKIYFNKGEGTWEEADLSEDEYATTAVVVNDMNGDGLLDVVAANVGHETQLFLGTGNGTFRNGLDISDDVFDTFALAVGDVNHDGRPDVVTGNYGSRNRLYLNSGGVQPFAGVSGSDISDDVFPTLSVKLGDVNGDGFLDCVTGNHDEVNRVYLNNGTASPFDGVTGENISDDKEETYSICLGDLDQDHDLDIACGNNVDQDRLYLNNGTATPFSGVTGIELEHDSRKTSSMLLLDVNNDRLLDIVTGFRAGADRVHHNPGRVRRNYGFLVPRENSTVPGTGTAMESGNSTDPGPIVGFVSGNNASECQAPHFDLNKNRVESRNINASGEEIIALKVGLQASLAPNTAVDFFVTNDDGAHWTGASDGKIVFFSRPGNVVRWKAVLHSRSSVHSARLTGVTLEVPEFVVTVKTDDTPGAALSGESNQRIKAGGRVSPVTAEPPQGYCFSKWVCSGKHFSYENPLVIPDIREDMEVTALFAREIADIAELRRIGADPAYPLDGRYCLQKDLDFPSQGENFTAIGSEETPFTGYFFGNNHAISGLQSSQAQQSFEGLFGDVAEGAEIRDLRLENVNISHNGSNTGGLAGRNNGLIENCQVTGRVCYPYYTDVRGALAGENGPAGVIRKCAVSAEVHGQGNYIGGLVGRNLGRIEDCAANADVSGHQRVGGIAGYQEGGSLVRCSALGRVNAVLGDAGGLVGSVINSALTESFATVEVLSQSGPVGGLIGICWEGQLKYCFASGSVTTQNGPAGVLVGMQDGGTVRTCYGTSMAAGSDVAGLLHFAEDNPPMVEHCYWDQKTTGCERGIPQLPAEEDTSGRTTQEMLKAATYTAWDINGGGPFAILEDKTYPYLACGIPKVQLRAIENRDENAAIFEVRFPFPVPGFAVSDMEITCSGVTCLEQNAVPTAANAFTLWSVPVAVKGALGTVSAAVNLKDVFRSDMAVATVFSGAPDTVALEPIGVDRIACSWEDQCAFEDGFQVYFAEGDLPPSEPVAKLPADTTTYSFDGLLANTMYSCSVSAHSGDLESPKSEPMTVWTWAHVPATPLLSDSTMDSIKVVVGAGDLNPPSTEYALRLCTEGEDVRWVQSGGIPGDTPEWKTADAWATVIVSELSPATAYRVSSVARNGAGTMTEPGPEEIIHTQCDLKYTAGENGTVSEAPRLAAYGSDGPPVTAKPDPGYRFAGWSDGSMENPRQDRNIAGNIAVEATFERLLSGAGSADAPYEISRVEELQLIADLPDKRFVLKNDIDASVTAGWNDGAGFLPVGNDKSPFTGTLDGQGHVVSGLVIKRPAEDNASLIGVAGPGGRITGIRLTNVLVEGRDNTGGLVGHDNGASILQCTVTGAVTGGKNTGGLIGFGERASVEQCASGCTVKGGENVGGLAGFNTDCTFVHCYALGAAEGNRNVGGLAGYVYKCGVTASYSRCTAQGTWYVGGLLGYNHTGSVRECYAAATVSGSGFVGGLLGFNDKGTIERSYWDREATGQETSPDSEVSSGKTTAEMRSAATYTEWNMTEVWTLEEGVFYPGLHEVPESAAVPAP